VRRQRRKRGSVNLSRQDRKAATARDRCLSALLSSAPTGGDRLLAFSPLSPLSLVFISISLLPISVRERRPRHAVSRAAAREQTRNGTTIRNGAAICPVGCVSYWRAGCKHPRLCILSLIAPVSGGRPLLALGFLQNTSEVFTRSRFPCTYLDGFIECISRSVPPQSS
jgi:hypothetical protein